MTRRVLHLITDLDVGGAEMMLLRSAPRLRARGWEPHVVSLLGEGTLGPELRRDGVAVEALRLGSAAGRAAAIPRLLRAVRRIRPDLLHGWMYHGNAAAGVVAGLTPHRVPTLLGIHQTVYGLEHEKRLTRLVIRLGARWSARAAGVVYVSDVSRRQHEMLGYEPARSVVIPNAVDTARLRPNPAAGPVIRARLGIAPDAEVLGLVARWHPMKDHRTFLEAAALVAARRPSARFVLAGRGVDDGNRDLMERLESLGLGRKVVAVGEVSDIGTLLPAIDVVCLSSTRGESFPLILAEAMAFGIPCVATDVGACATLLGEGGRIVAPGAPTALGDACEAVLSLPAADRRALGASLRRRVVDRYDLELVADRYGELYERAALGSLVIGRSRRPAGRLATLRGG